MKKAFTIVEVIISIFIFSLIMILLYKSVGNLRQSNKILAKNSQKNKSFSKVIKLLKEDLVLSKDFQKVKNKKNYFKLTTLNSIHNIAKPKVEWKVLKSGELVRVESNFLDDTTLKCQELEIVSSHKKNSYIIYIKLQNGQEILGEVLSSSKPNQSTSPSKSTTKSIK